VSALDPIFYFLKIPLNGTQLVLLNLYCIPARTISALAQEQKNKSQIEACVAPMPGRAEEGGTLRAAAVQLEGVRRAYTHAHIVPALSLRIVSRHTSFLNVYAHGTR
jgi:hypothetical protein